MDHPYLPIIFATMPPAKRKNPRSRKREAKRHLQQRKQGAGLQGWQVQTMERPCQEVRYGQPLCHSLHLPLTLRRCTLGCASYVQSQVTMVSGGCRPGRR
eukprot:COSAG01_NODE_2399_length_7763_cov_4.446764_4_plen_100_part_00